MSQCDFCVIEIASQKVMGPGVAADEEVTAIEVALVGEDLLGALDGVVRGVHEPQLHGLQVVPVVVVGGERVEEVV